MTLYIYRVSHFLVLHNQNFLRKSSIDDGDDKEFVIINKGQISAKENQRVMRLKVSRRVEVLAVKCKVVHYLY